MGLVTKPFTFTNGATIIASEHNSNFDVLYSEVNGNLSNANISGSAGIIDSKLATISTAGKVAGSAITTALTSTGAGMTGEIKMWGTTTAPSGWLSCDGTAVSRSTYSALFAIIGTNFGIGDGSSTFNLPSLKGNVPVGYDAAQTEFDAIGETGGSKTVTLTSAQSGVPAHSHSETYRDNSGGGSGQPAMTTASGAQGSFSVDNNVAADAAEAHSNLQPYITLLFIIKT